MQVDSFCTISIEPLKTRDPPPSPLPPPPPHSLLAIEHVVRANDVSITHDSINAAPRRRVTEAGRMTPLPSVCSRSPARRPRHAADQCASASQSTRHSRIFFFFLVSFNRLWSSVVTEPKIISTNVNKKIIDALFIFAKHDSHRVSSVRTSSALEPVAVAQ